MRLVPRSLVLASAMLVACAASEQVTDPGSGDGAGGASTTGTGGAAGSGGQLASGGAAAGGQHAGGAGGRGGQGGAGGGGIPCVAPSADCNHDAADGCESDLDLDPTSCGACGTVCPAKQNGKATCEGGVCASACAPGFADCNGVAGDGCEVSTANDVGNCGACGHACSPGPNAPAACQAGTCYLVCPPKTGDCDGNAVNGCEQDLLVDPANCGACHKDCGGAGCVQGSCSCASETQQGNPVPLDVFLMIDRSSSMSSLVVGGGTRWTAVTTALTAFFDDPQNAAVGVGMQYFALPYSVPPPDGCTTDADCLGYAPCVFFSCDDNGGSTDSCDAADYAKADVEIAPLDAAQRAALESSIAAHQPQHDTPTAPALEGAIQHASAWAKAHPTHVTVVVLATDGKPTECTVTAPAEVAKIAAAGVAASPSVKTFVIGVGPSLQSLDAIAAGGGTGAAFLVDSNANVVQQFGAALAQIHKSALGCEYAIPVPKQGKLDYQKVNVEYTPGNGGAPQLLSNVANQAACDPNTGGWYYDDNLDPKKILLCDASCAQIGADAKAKIDVVLGCATVHL